MRAALKRALPLGKVYGLLEPGPVVLLTTAHAGRANVMTMSWHTMLEFEPPLVGCVVSESSHSFGLLMKTRECALNIPDVSLARKVVGCGNTSGRDIDKFAKFGLTPLAAERIGAPLVAECHAALECRVKDTRMVAAYNLFVLEVVRAWTAPSARRARTLHHKGWGRFMVAGRTVGLPSAMR